MGVTYKLTDEIVDFILAKKNANRRLGVRKLADQVMEHFSVKVSKSSVSNVLKNADLNTPTGRKRSSSKPAFQIPEEKKQQWRDHLQKVAPDAPADILPTSVVPDATQPTIAAIPETVPPEQATPNLPMEDASVGPELPADAIHQGADPERDPKVSEIPGDVDWRMAMPVKDSSVLEDAGLLIALAFWRELCPPDFWKMVLPPEWAPVLPREMAGEAWLCATLAAPHGGVRDWDAFSLLAWGSDGEQGRAVSDLLKRDKGPKSAPAKLSVAVADLDALCWNVRVHLKNGKKLYFRPDCGEISDVAFEDGGLPVHNVVKWVTDELVVPNRTLNVRKVVASNFDTPFFVFQGVCSALPGYEIERVDVLDRQGREWASFDQIMPGVRQYIAGIPAGSEAEALLKDELEKGAGEAQNISGRDFLVQSQIFDFQVERISVGSCISGVSFSHYMFCLVGSHEAVGEYLHQWGCPPVKAVETRLPMRSLREEVVCRLDGQMTDIVSALLAHMSRRIAVNASGELSVETLQKIVAMRGKIQMWGDHGGIVYDSPDESDMWAIDSTMTCLNSLHMGADWKMPYKFYVVAPQQ